MLEELYDTSLAQEKRDTQFTVFYLPVPYTKNLRCVFVKVHKVHPPSWNFTISHFKEPKVEKHGPVISTDRTGRTGSDIY
jgi:hypothetical protein